MDYAADKFRFGDTLWFEYGRGARYRDEVPVDGGDGGVGGAAAALQQVRGQRQAHAARPATLAPPPRRAPACAPEQSTQVRRLGSDGRLLDTLALVPRRQGLHRAARHYPRTPRPRHYPRMTRPRHYRRTLRPRHYPRTLRPRHYRRAPRPRH